MRRPAPKKLSDIQHPGPRCPDRLPYRLGRADKVSFRPPENVPLLRAISDWIETRDFHSAVLDLSGLSLESFRYVMPDRAVDSRHAAWYSDTRSSEGARLKEAVAIVGRKEGDWFAHIHAFWNDGGVGHLGHLLPDSLILKKSTEISGYGIKGAAFVAAPDPETEFTLFRVRGVEGSEEEIVPNALISTLAPFEDLTVSILKLSENLNTRSIEVLGLGSLAGAAFEDAAPMKGLISEILLQPTCSVQADNKCTIPIRCVDLDGRLHQGKLQAGEAPTLVTCELLLIESKQD
ncbi:MAG: hypothetical protein NXI02_07595 [Rhodobacteraceae bacterium]|nr:hypothetical protein [Paracoccaceae bacterium]